eukprot:scaffold4376_cov170-Skeletonema_marinoi.AAC.3
MEMLKMRRGKDAKPAENRQSFSMNMKDIPEEQNDIQTHQVTPETDSDERDMDHLPPLKLFDNLLKQFYFFCARWDAQD